MKILSYNEVIDPKLTRDHPFNRKCLYCSKDLEFEETKKISKVSFHDFHEQFKQHIKWMKGFNGPFEKEYFKIEDELNYEGSHVKRCLYCGWWSIYDEYWVAARWQLWQVFYGITGVIKNINLRDLSVPIIEIRNHLARYYCNRFHVNPRKFEEVVTSIFKDIGFQALCTSYSNDGGIDIMLEKEGNLSAVQVKRTKNSIKLEQVRSFLGALVCQGLKEGIYVSTSEFQTGCYKIAKSNSIRLFGGSKFYNLLLEAQMIQYSNIPAPNLTDVNLDHCGCYEMNSL